MLQHTSFIGHAGQTHTVPASPTMPELLPEPPEELLEPPLEDEEPPLDVDEPPLDDEEPPLEDPDIPLDEPLPDPPPLELELLVGAHSVAQCAVVHEINLSPSPHTPPVQPQSPAHLIAPPPRSTHPA